MDSQPDYEVAYILKGFPRLSETFISNEIHLLETMQSTLKHRNHLIGFINREVLSCHDVFPPHQRGLINWPLRNSQ